nr:MAG TPA: Protein of unknown function (DUF3703) [Caudoviricetes sp.]DAV13750.1 MAG TPA: Protein of unknown function (DUF3703) [Caudoviricetes sp.]
MGQSEHLRFVSLAFLPRFRCVRLPIGNTGRHSVDDRHTFMVPDYSFFHFCSTPLWNFLTIQL